MSAEKLSKIDADCPLSLARARDGDRRVRHVVGARSGPVQRWYKCNVCGSLVYSEPFHRPMTRYAEEAVRAHARWHEEQEIAASMPEGTDPVPADGYDAAGGIGSGSREAARG